MRRGLPQDGWLIFLRCRTSAGVGPRGYRSSPVNLRCPNETMLDTEQTTFWVKRKIIIAEALVCSDGSRIESTAIGPDIFYLYSL